MALIKADRVKETSTSTGTGTFALAGAATGYRAFSSVCAVGDTFYYAISNQSNGEWEVGLGTYSAANTLTRTTIHSSSNSNLIVTFSAGTKEVFISASKAWLDTFITQTSGTTNYIAKATGTGTIGDSQIYDNGTNVGIGTASPDSWGAGLTIYKSANNSIGLTVINPSATSSASSTITLGSAVTGGAYGIISRNNSYFTGSGLYDSPSTLYIDSNYNNLQLGSYASYAIKLFTNNTQRLIVSSAGLVGINETSPGAQLQVTTAAAATKGLIVKGAAAQSAFMFEVQDSNGRASVAATNSFSTTITDSSGQLFVQVNDAVAANIGAQISLGGNYVGTTSTVFGAISAKKENATSGNYAGYLQLITSTHGVGNTEKVRITSAGDVGIGATSPVAKLQLGTGTDVMANAGGLTVVGGGLVLDGAGTYADRELYFRYTSTVATISADKALRFRTSNGNTPVEAMRIDVVGNIGIGTTSPAHKLDISHTSTNLLQLKQTAYNYTNLQFYSYHGSLVLAGGGVGLLIYDRDGVARFNIDTFNRKLGINTTSPSATTHSVCDASTTKGLIVQGASGQSANLQEWQNNSGTALAYINSSGVLVVPEIYAPVITDTGGVGYYKQYFITRTLPDTVGDYVEFLEYAHTVGTRFKIDVMAADYPYWDSATYEFNSIWDNGSYIMPPKFRYHRHTSDLVLEKVHGQTNPYASRLRLRRIGAKSSAGSTTVRIRVEVWASQLGGLPTDASATGTSTLSSYGSDQSFCNPSLQAPPQLVAGSGTSISLSPSQYLTSGNNGEVIVYGNVENSDGTPPSTLKLYGGTTSGDCSRLMLAHHMTWNNGTPFGVKSHYELRRTLPTTVGDYIELFKHGWGNNAHFRITIITSRSSWIAGTIAKVYEFQPSAGNFTAVFPPTYSWGGDSSDDYVLERVATSGVEVRYRLRRTASTNTIYAYVHVELFNSENMNWIQMLSGTGTSTVGNNYFDQGFSVPSVSAPVSARMSGNASDLSLYGASANGTGNGGNILLQAGAYATSGSNGKVIVRGLASNTANLQEWQNNAGTALAYIRSNGTAVISPVSASGDSNAGLSVVGVTNDNDSGLTIYPNNLSLATKIGWSAISFSGTSANINVGSNTNSNALYCRSRVQVGNSAADYSSATLHVSPLSTSSTGISVRAANSQTANLQEWQNNSGTALASVDASGNINAQAVTNFGRNDTYFDSWYGSINRRVYRVNVPSTIGNYQEIFKLNWHSNTIAKIKVYAFGSGIYNAKEYDFNSTYGSEGVLLPSRSAYLYNTISVQYELESKWDPASGWNTIRVKRTSGSDTLILLVYVEVLDATSGHPVVASGTGTSSISGVLGSYSSLTSISPPDVVGGSGNGYDLNLYGGAGLGTGNGGNIILRAGAYSTSGSNGKVIVRGLAGNTANLQEWQNNAGTVLAYVDSAGKFRASTGYFLTSDLAGFVINGNRIGIGTSVSTIFGCEYGNYMRPNIVSYFPDGAGYIGTIINTSSTYADATAKLLSVQNNGTEKFAVFSDGSMAGVDARLTGSIKITSNTPSAFTVDQNDLALTASGFQRLSGTAARNITGIAPPSGSHVDGRMMRIYNVGSYNLTLKHNSTASSAPNRFFNVQSIDIIIGPNDYAELIYDGTNNGSGAAGWRVA